MKLYQDRKLFKQLITLTSKELKIPLSIVEKDYHIMNILKELMAIDNSIVFKGGTSLSKCFKVINRFSEDLDLSYYNGNNNPTESMRKRLNKSIVDISSKLGVIVSYTKFGEFMRILRVKNHEVMGDIAKLLGVSTPFLSAVENGKKNVPAEKLDLSKSSDYQRYAALQFARSFDDIDEDIAKKILELLKRSKID